jgi:hypothetical protein
MRSLSFARASAGLAAALLGVVLLQPHRAEAEGAIAVGEPKDVAKEGYAYGFSTGKADMKTATAEALEACRKPDSSSSEPGRKLCKVIGTFTNECVAVALDPGMGTPGVGWAIGGNLKIAESMAIQRCKSTAGPGRGDYCKIDNSRCDGEAK